MVGWIDCGLFQCVFLGWEWCLFNLLWFAWVLSTWWWGGFTENEGGSLGRLDLDFNKDYRSTKLGLEKGWLSKSWSLLLFKKISHVSLVSWGLCRVFVKPALTWNLLLQYISWGHLGHLCDLQPLSFSQSLQCNQPYTKIPTTLLPPKNKIEISPCFPLYTYTILYPITYTKKNTMRKKKEQNCSQKIGAKLLWPPSHSFNSATWRDFIHGVTWWTDQLVDFLLQRNLLFWNSFSL